MLKMTGKFLLIGLTAALMLSAAAKETAVQPAAVKYTDPQAAAELEARKKVLEENIRKKRQELLRTDPKLRRMHEQLLKQIRAIAIELDSKKEMRSLNDAAKEIDVKLDKLRK